MALDDEELSAAAERQSHSILGRVQVEPGRHLFPLAIERPQQFAQKRIALVGEAAHVVPPIGAQGLNLGLRDAADIADIVRKAMAAGEDPGAPQVLTRYAVARGAPISLSRTFAIDIANRSLLSDLLPMQSLRAAGMHLIGSFGPLRRLAMREGLAPSWRTPRAADSVHGNTSRPLWMNHITLVSVTTDAKVPIRTATEAGSIQVSFCRAITNTFKRRRQRCHQHGRRRPGLSKRTEQQHQAERRAADGSPASPR